MLTISPAVTVTGVPTTFGKTDYILFPDSENKDLYYALAERPNFLADGEGHPNFNLTWYFGGGMEPGGICTMTVGLPMPDMAKPEVREVIAAALTKDPDTIKQAQRIDDMCRAMERGEADRVAALKQALGYSDDMAKQKKAIFQAERDWSQFLAAAVTLDIRPVPFKGGSVSVQAFAAKESYLANSPEYSSGKIEVTPSLVNSNAAVVTFNLREIGANLFWHALGGWTLDASKQPKGYDAVKGGGSIIAVTYAAEFDGLLPEAKAVVTLDHKVMAKLNIEEQVHRGAWGSTYRTLAARGKEYDDVINSSTRIVLPPGASKDVEDSVRKTLTDWAAGQLEDMLKVKMPEVKLDDLNVDSARQLSTATNQSRTYTLTQGIPLRKNPQGQLPKISALVKEDALKKHFNLIDLNERPYFNVDVTVQAPSVEYLKQRKIDRLVVTHLSYANEKMRDKTGHEVENLEYATNAQQPSQTLSGTFAAATPNKFVSYAYLVAYSDGTPPFRAAPTRQDGGDNYVALGGVDVGVLNVTFDGVDLPWDIISGARLDIAYGDWTKTNIVLRQDTPLSIVQPFGKAMTGKLTYRLTLTPKAGAPIAGERQIVDLQQGNADVTLINPLGDTIETIGFQLADEVERARIRVEYTLRGLGDDRIFVQIIDLDSNRPNAAAFSWNVPVFQSKRSSLRLLKAQITAGGTSSTLNEGDKRLKEGGLDTVLGGPIITVERDGFSTF